MQWATAVGLEKCDRQRMENRQTEKTIKEATLIIDGMSG